MRTINAFSKAVLFCGCAILGSAGSHAETITRDAGVTVIRGIDDAGTAAQRQSSRGRSGVVVFRGASTASVPPVQPQATAAPAPTMVVGGQNLWIYDSETNTATACSLRYDFYGNRKVRCSSD